MGSGLMGSGLTGSGLTGPWAVYTSRARVLASDGASAASELEELGFAAVWVADVRGELDAVGQLLGGSRTLHVGTAVLSVWDRTPAEAGAAFHQIDDVTPGRAVLGIGISHAPLVERAGGTYARPLATVRAHLDGLDDARVPAAQRMLGANGPRMVALAGERCAGALTYMVTPERTAMHRAQLGPGPALVAEQKVVLDADPVSARSTARAHLAVYLGLPNYLGNLRVMGFTDGDLADGGSDRLVDAVVAWGSAETIAERARAHRDAGADQVALHVITADAGMPRAAWRELATALPLPRTRGARS